MNIKQETFYKLAGTHQSGEISKLLTNLREHNVDLIGLWGFPTSGGNAEFLLVPKNDSQLTSMASKLNFTLQKSTCFHLSAEDKLGILEETLHKAASAGINIRAVNALSAGSEVGCYIWCEDEDVEKLAQTLGA